MSKKQTCDGDVAASPGDVVFDGRGGRRVEVRSIDWLTGVPRAVCVERPVPCGHAALLALGGGCPLCPARVVDATPFEVALTWAGGAWRMPLAYSPVA